MQTFGSLFRKSTKELKANFKLYAQLIFLFIFIPSVLLAALSFTTVDESTQATMAVILITLTVIVLFINVLASTGIYASALFKKNNYKAALSKGKSFYWRYVWFSIVLTIFMIGLFALFIIPGIIFAVYWVFAIYIFILEKKGIMPALRKSKKLVKGKWWDVLGYSILFGLITLGIYIIFLVPTWPTGIMLSMDAIQNPALYAEGASPTTLAITHNTLVEFFELLSRFITLPLSIIFYKNFYLSMKK